MQQNAVLNDGYWFNLINAVGPSLLVSGRISLELKVFDG